MPLAAGDLPTAPLADAYRGAAELKGSLGLGADVVGFVRWLDRSDRLGPAGSPWWQQIDGAMIFDMDEAVRLLRAGTRPEQIDDPAVRAWALFANATTTPGLSRSVRQQALWDAHQLSIHSEVPHASGTLALEHANERAFITRAIRSLDTVALAKWPTDERLGAGHVFRGYLRLAYPGNYPPSNARVFTLAFTEADRFPASLLFGRPSNIGLESTRWSDNRIRPGAPAQITLARRESASAA